MGMSRHIWENNGNGNKCLAAMGTGMGLKLTEMGRNGKPDSHSRTPLLSFTVSCHRHAKLKLASGGITFSGYPFDRLSVRPSVRYQTCEHDIFARNLAIANMSLIPHIVKDDSGNNCSQNRPCMLCF